MKLTIYDEDGRARRVEFDVPGFDAGPPVSEQPLIGWVRTRTRTGFSMPDVSNPWASSSAR